MTVRQAFANSKRPYPFFAWDAIEGTWRRIDGRAVYAERDAMAELRELDNEDDKVIDAVPQPQPKGKRILSDAAFILVLMAALFVAAFVLVAVASVPK